MLEAYSTNVEVAAESAIPFRNVTLKKGCTVELSGDSSIELNKCGVYMVEVDATAGTSTTVQLVKDGVAQPQAQSTGTGIGFTTLVQVARNNSGCCCSSPVTIQAVSSGAATFTNVNVCVTKIC